MHGKQFLLDKIYANIVGILSLLIEKYTMLTYVILETYQTSQQVLCDDQD